MSIIADEILAFMTSSFRSIYLHMLKSKFCPTPYDLGVSKHEQKVYSGMAKLRFWLAFCYRPLASDYKHELIELPGSAIH